MSDYGLSILIWNIRGAFFKEQDARAHSQKRQAELKAAIFRYSDSEIVSFLLSETKDVTETEGGEWFNIVADIIHESDEKKALRIAKCLYDEAGEQETQEAVTLRRFAKRLADIGAP
ncbi:MAG: hypothetical protein Q8N68_00135 [bacterium]|nr:hypothetical protein [bacterium]